MERSLLPYRGGRIRPFQGNGSHLFTVSSQWPDTAWMSQQSSSEQSRQPHTGRMCKDLSPWPGGSPLYSYCPDKQPRLQPLQVSENCLNFYRYPARKSITKRAQDTLAAITFLKPHIRWEIKIWKHEREIKDI